MRVAGYFQGVMGTGEHGRQLAAALRSQGVSCELITVHPDGSPEDSGLAPAGTDTPGRAEFDRFNLLCVNADMAPHVVGQLGSGFTSGRYTIGFWAWEVAKFPDQFRPGFKVVDEVWVGSDHVRDAVAANAPVPVLTVPQPISLADDAPRCAPPTGLPDGFRFLFAFDYLSVFARKNPLDTITAFTRAFSPGAGATLIVKALNPDRDPAHHEQVRAAVSAHPDVHLIERRLSRSERDGLMNQADAYVSLHRAEGFGYTLAESMWLGKPVIATGYSGNIDFMTGENSYLVDHRLVPIGPGSEPYPADALWAQPDTEHAARLMRHVFEHRDEARARGQRAASDIRASHGLEAAGRAMRARLETLEESLPAQGLLRRLQRMLTSSPVSRSR